MSLYTSLVSFWELEEASGSRADAAGTNTLTDNATVTSGTGKVGTGATFTAANSEFLSHTSNSDLQTGDVDWTISLWFKATSTAALQSVLSKHNETSGNAEYSILITTDPVVRVYTFRATDSQAIINSSVTLSNGTWYHVVTSHDATADTISVWVNLTADSAGTGGALQAAGTAPFYIGGRAYAASLLPFDGMIDQVGLWKRVLTSQERTDLYNGGAGLSYAAMAPATGRVSRMGLLGVG